MSTEKKAKKPAKPAEHPNYSDMVSAAVGALKERNGSSRQAILKYIQANYKVSDNCGTRVKVALKRMSEKGALVHTKGKGASGSFKLAKKPEKPKVAKKKPAAKKPAAKKPAAKKVTKKPAAKKPAVKKSPKKSPKKPAVKKSTPKKAAAKPAKKPAAKKPAAKKAAKKPAAKKAVKKSKK